MEFYDVPNASTWSHGGGRSPLKYDPPKWAVSGISLTEILIFLCLILGFHLINNHYNYLFFHTFAELFSIVVAVTFAMISINCWKSITNNYIKTIGPAYLFVSSLDLLHTLSFKGMPIFTDYDYYAPQFWIASRYLEAASSMAGLMLLGSKYKINLFRLMSIYSIVTIAATISILYFKIFPVCFVAGRGLTEFKIVSEYIICAIFFASICIALLKRQYFEPNIFRQIVLSLLSMALMEICFTLYASDNMSDLFNEIGHFFKIIAFYLIYKSIIVTALRDPIHLLFTELKTSEENLREAQHIAHIGQWSWDLESDSWRWTDEIDHFLRRPDGERLTRDRMLAAVPSEDREVLRAAFVNCADRGVPFNAVVQMSSSPEQTRYAELRGRPVRTPAGSICGIAGTLQDVTEQRRMLDELAEREIREARIRASEERFRWTFEQAAVGIVHTGIDGQFLRCNEKFAEITGYPIEEVSKLRFQDLTLPEELEESVRNVRELFEGKIERAVFENRYRRRDGSMVWVKLTCSVQRDDDGRPLHLINVVEDIDARKNAEEQLRLAYLVYESSSEAMVVTAADSTIISVNPAFTRLTGYTLEEAVGKRTNLLNSGRQEREFFEEMWAQLNATGRWHGEIWNRRKNGELFLEWLSINSIFNKDGTVFRRVALFSDITELKKSQETIWQQANFDALTNLPNRRMFYDRLQQEIKKCNRSGHRLALLFIDLDRFKEVNDTLGHEKGDILLQEVARRLGNCVRETDTVGRLGGDEFTILISELTERGSLDRVAGTILEKVAVPYRLGQDIAYVSASIGITIFPDDAGNIEGLLKNADHAMYESKHHGRNRYNYFKPFMQEASIRRVTLANDLRTALSNQELHIHFQPIVELGAGHIRKAEALLRWRHPSRGPISPQDFIPIAEETGLIVEIGDWVFRESANYAARWKAKFGAAIQISVNRSPVQFRDDDTKSPDWQEFLSGLGLEGNAIAVEITESLLLDAAESVNAKLLKFHESGIQISLDDFGTGYSSLSYLQKFPIDYMKIDQSFVRGLTPNSRESALCDAIIVMAHKLGMKVIAEGIETEEQRVLLMAAGCDYGQGYLFSRPVPPEEFERFLGGGAAPQA